MITLIVFVVQNTLWSSPLCSLLQHSHYHNYKNITTIIHTHLSKNTVSFFVFCIGRALTYTVLTFCFFWVGTLVRLFTHLIVPGDCTNNTHYTYYFVTIYSYLIIERLNYSIWQCFINYIIWYILPLEQFGDLCTCTLLCNCLCKSPLQKNFLSLGEKTKQFTNQWYRELFPKPKMPQTVNKFLAYYKTQIFLTILPRP